MPARPPRKNKQDGWIQSHDLNDLQTPPYRWPDRDLLSRLTGDETDVFQGDWDRYGKDVVKLMWQGLSELKEPRLWVIGFGTNPPGILLFAKEHDDGNPANDTHCIQIVLGKRGYKVDTIDLPEGAEVILHNGLQVIPPFVTPRPKTTPVYKWPKRHWLINYCQAQAHEAKFPAVDQWDEWGSNVVHCLWAHLEKFNKVTVYLVAVVFEPSLGVIFYATAENGFTVVVKVDNSAGWQMHDYMTDVDKTLEYNLVHHLHLFRQILPPPPQMDEGVF